MHQYGREDGPGLRQLLLDIHDDCYAGEEDPFHARERFTWFVDHWSSREGWCCVIGYDGDEPTGFAYGAPLQKNGWWRGIDGLTGQDTWEDGTRTFAVSEIMVRPAWRGQGQAGRMHGALLADRREQRATLLADSSHVKTLNLYRSWGYVPLGEMRPADDAPSRH
nr:GNAT family N-acetyltransferase [Streptomyces sp. HNM0574]